MNRRPIDAQVMKPWPGCDRRGSGRSFTCATRIRARGRFQTALRASYEALTRCVRTTGPLTATVVEPEWRSPITQPMRWVSRPLCGMGWIAR